MGALSTSTFWLATLERAIKTFAQAIVAVLLVASTTPVDIDWVELAYTGGLAALISVLTSIVSAGVGRHAGPSLATEELAPVAPVPLVAQPVIEP